MGPEPPIVRKLTARSAILSALLGAHPAQVPAGSIVRVAAELGFQESATRVALTRMVAGGDLERHDSVYRLAARLIERQRQQDTALHPDPKIWNGDWRLAVITVTSEDSTDRAALRETMRAMKFGELREGVWTRPDNLRTDFPAAASRRVTFFTARPDDLAPGFAESLFRPQRWAARARELLTAFETATAIAARFEVAAAAVRHILDDPLLPEELLPQPWPGNDIRREYEIFRNEFSTYVERLLTTTTS